MYIQRATYLEQAKRLQPGTSKKVPHPGCTDSDAMLISNNRKGYSAWCFKCGLSGFTRHDYLSLHDQTKYHTAAQQERKRHARSDTLTLPADFCHAIPTPDIVWLWKYGITDEEIVRFGIGWSPGLKRIVLPVYSKGKLIYWQGRATSPDLKPKYLNIRGNTSAGIHFVCVPESRESSETNTKPSRCVCIVEDILSAIKVGRVCTGISFLGSAITQQAYSVIRPFRKRYTWYDSDRAGRHAAQSYHRLFGSLAEATDINTKRDPKEYSTRVIRERLR